MKTGTSCVLTSFWLFSVDSLFSREVELLKTRRFVKHLKSLRVLILDFDPLFFTDGLHDPKAFYKVKMTNDDLYKWWRTYQLLVNVFNKWRIYQGKTTDSFLKKNYWNKYTAPIKTVVYWQCLQWTEKANPTTKQRNSGLSLEKVSSWREKGLGILFPLIQGQKLLKLL